MWKGSCSAFYMYDKWYQGLFNGCKRWGKLYDINNKLKLVLKISATLYNKREASDIRKSRIEED